MSLAIDAVILFSAIFIIWSGTSKGFVRSFMGLISTVVSFLVAYAYTPVLSAYVKGRFLLHPITEGINESLRSMSRNGNTNLFDLDRLAKDLPEPFTGILERFGIDLGDFASKLQGLTECSESQVYAFAQEIADPTASLLSSVISFIVLFLGALLALTILTSLLNLLFRLPVLKTANMFFGFLLGVVQAAAVAVLLASVLSVLVTALGPIDPALFGEDVISDTMICSKILEWNVVDKLLGLLGR